MRVHIAGIDLVPDGSAPFNLEGRGLVAFPFVVEGPGGVTRGDLSRLIGHSLHGKPIKGVESYAVESQCGKKVSIAVDA